MTKREIIRALRGPNRVFVFVAWTFEDAYHVLAGKDAVFQHVESLPGDVEFRARVCPRTGDLYIG